MAAPAKAKMGKGKRLVLGIVAAVIVVGVMASVLGGNDRTREQPSRTPSARTPVAAATWTRDNVVADLRSEGFTGSESQLADGTPRWLGQGPNSAIAEVVGPSNNVSKITLTVIAGEEAGRLMGRFLNTYAPGSRQFFTDTLNEYSGEDLNRSRRFGDVTVSLQTVTMGDSGFVLTSLSR